MIYLGWGLAVLASIGFIGGFMGSYHGLGDLLAAFRLENIVLLAGLALCFAYVGKWTGAVTMFALVIVGVVTVAPYLMPQTGKGGKTYTLYQKNLGSGRTDIPALMADIDAMGADFLTLQEVLLDDVELQNAIKERFAHSYTCFERPKGAMTVASKFPIIIGSEQCSPEWGLVKLQAQTPDGPVWVVSMHSFRPFPWVYAQNLQAKYLQSYMPSPENAFIIGGDFNSVPWGSSLLSTTRHMNAKFADRRRITYTRALGLLRLSLDHVLLDQSTQSGGTERRPLVGSDHYGLVARFDLKSRP